MSRKDLTTAYIQRNKDPGDITCNISVSEVKSFKDNPNILVIQSVTESCTRLTIYPIERDEIVKISLSGSNISDKSITDFSNILQNYEILHSSGLLIKAEELYYECYLKLSLSDNKIKDLKTSLDEFSKIFKAITIEKIEKIGI